MTTNLQEIAGKQRIFHCLNKLGKHLFDRDDKLNVLVKDDGVFDCPMSHAALRIYSQKADKGAMDIVADVTYAIVADCCFNLATSYVFAGHGGKVFQSKQTKDGHWLLHFPGGCGLPGVSGDHILRPTRAEDQLESCHILHGYVPTETRCNLVQMLFGRDNYQTPVVE